MEMKENAIRGSDIISFDFTLKKFVQWIKKERILLCQAVIKVVF